MARSWSLLGHLVRRFVAGFDETPPSADDEAWVATCLRPEELAVWRAQRAADRRHTVGVARRVADLPDVPDWVVAAALLHDVGKAEAPLAPPGRAVATVLELVGIRRAPGVVGRYLQYQVHGAELLAAIGSDERVVTWARDHHRAESAWAVPQQWGRALRAADDAAG